MFRIKPQLAMIFPLFCMIGLCLIPLGLNANVSLVNDSSAPIIQEQTPFSAAQGIINSNNRNILHWIHVSDVHINLDEMERLQKFNTLCNQTFQTINPTFIISSGDNVDGGNAEYRNQRLQVPAEYEHVNNTIKKFNLTNNYYSVIGNHEKYNTINDSPYFTYIRNETNYIVNVSTPFGIYRYIFVDTTQNVGMKNFFNLYGEMTTAKLDALELLLTGQENNKFNQTIVIGHHPINNIVSQRSRAGNTFRDVLENCNTLVYLTGHVHMKNFNRIDHELIESMAPAFENDYTYRICALDNDIYSFSEEIVDEWPAVVVTNAVDAHFYTEKQPLDRIKTSTEIRTLIFDPKPITSAYVEIDGEIIGNLTNQGQNLWIITWDPAKYTQGEHTLKVIIASDSGSTERSIPFKLDSFEPIPLTGLGPFFLNLPIYSGLIALLSILMILILIPFLGAQLDGKLGLYHPKNPHFFVDQSQYKTFKQKLFLKPWVQAHYLPKLAKIGLLVFLGYILTLPYMIAELIDPYYGFVWLYGVRIAQYTVLTPNSYMMGAIQLLSYWMLQTFTIRKNGNHLNIFGYLPLLISIGAQGFEMYMIISYFGFVMVFINPIFYVYIVVLVMILFSFWNNSKHKSE